MLDWTAAYVSGLIGSLLGAGTAYALVRSRLRSMRAQHREELAAQHEELTDYFLESLRSQVLELRAQAQVRLLGLIFNHLAEKCLPAYQEVRDACDRVTTCEDVTELMVVVRRLESTLARGTEAVEGMSKILEAHRNQDEIYGQFSGSLDQAARTINALRAATQAIAAHLSERDEVRDAELASRCEALGRPIGQFGEWIKQCLEHAARMQNALLSAQPTAPAAAARSASDFADHKFDLVI